MGIRERVEKGIKVIGVFLFLKDLIKWSYYKHRF